MGILGKNFTKIVPVSSYFDLFTELLELQAMQDGLVDELGEEAVGIELYDPETLLTQIIDKIIAS